MRESIMNREVKQYVHVWAPPQRRRKQIKNEDEKKLSDDLQPPPTSRPSFLPWLTRLRYVRCTTILLFMIFSHKYVFFFLLLFYFYFMFVVVCVVCWTLVLMRWDGYSWRDVIDPIHAQTHANSSIHKTTTSALVPFAIWQLTSTSFFFAAMIYKHNTHTEYAHTEHTLRLSRNAHKPPPHPYTCFFFAIFFPLCDGSVRVTGWWWSTDGLCMPIMPVMMHTHYVHAPFSKLCASSVLLLHISLTTTHSFFMYTQTLTQQHIRSSSPVSRSCVFQCMWFCNCTGVDAHLLHPSSYMEQKCVDCAGIPFHVIDMFFFLLFVLLCFCCCVWFLHGMTRGWCCSRRAT